MNRAPKSRRINTKVTERDYRLLQRVVKEYRFRSVYQLVQTLVVCFIRHIDTVRDMEYERSYGVEIDEMFDEFMAPQAKSKAFTTYKEQKKHEG